MAIGVLVLGESGTGKTYSAKKFSPDEVKILSVTKPILPFRGKFEVVKTPTGKDVIREMKNTKKKNIVIDDFQYILGKPMMSRIGEKGWDKFGEIEQPYADVLDAINDLPDDVIVYVNSHIEYDDNGKRKIKTVGKALDKYLTVEGLFMIVLGTMVSDGNYFFSTQNNGADTVKSPEGMFPSMYIPNDLKYVEEKIRNYYYMDGAMSDEEIAAEDAANTVDDSEVVKKRGRRGRSTDNEEAPKDTVAAVDTGTGTITGEEPKKKRSRKNRTVTPEAEIAPDTKPAKVEAEEELDDEDLPFYMTEYAKEDGYYYIPKDNNAVMIRAGQGIPDGAQPITKEQFNAAVSLIAKEGSKADISTVINGETDSFMNVPEGTDEEIPFDEIDKHPELQVKPEDTAPARVSRRRRKV